MTNVKDAVHEAELFFQTVMGDKISDIWLEEVEPSPDEKVWLITLSALAPSRKTALSTPLSNLAELGSILNPVKAERLYKVFTVDATTNTVKAMTLPKAE